MTSPIRDDRILFPIRIVFALFAVLVVPSFVALYFHPTESATNFAWPLAPRMSAFVFAALYLAVVVGFVRVTFARKWHHVELVAWATLPVLVSLGVVTLLHWSKFTSDPIRFGIWILAYLVLPLPLASLIALNRRRDPRVPDADDVRLGATTRRVSWVFAAMYAATAVILIFFPSFASGVWPWPLKPLSSQALGSLALAPAIVHALGALDGRWSAVRFVAEDGMVWLLGIWSVMPRAFSEFDTSRPLTWAFIAVLVVETLYIGWLFVSCESRRRAVRVARSAGLSARS